MKLASCKYNDGVVSCDRIGFSSYDGKKKIAFQKLVFIGEDFLSVLVMVPEDGMTVRQCSINFPVLVLSVRFI